MALDPSYGTVNYEEQGGARHVFGGAVNYEPGHTEELGGNVIPKVVSGSYTVTAGDQTATAATIPTGLTTVSGQIVQILRSNVDVQSDAAITHSGGNVVVTHGAATYTLTAGDVVNWIAYGTV